MPELLSIHTSDDLHGLVERLADRLAAAPLPPLATETVVVQSQGMGRWLQLELARRHGVAGSLATPFPGTFIRNLAGHVLPDSEPSGSSPIDPFERTTLTWRIHRLLHHYLDHDAFIPLQNYLRDDLSGQKAVQLAARIARCFEDYQLYRPDMLEGWNAPTKGAGMLPFDQSMTQVTPSGDARWQKVLWASLCREVESLPLGTVLRELPEHLRRHGPTDDAPPRLAVFGVSHLPPPFLDVLWGYARHRPVDLYLLLPSELIERRGHPLLDAMGRQGLDLFEELEARDPEFAQFEPHAAPPRPAPRTALGVLQRDLREMHDRADSAPEPMAERDASLTIHECHSPRREVEVLRDQILRAFDELDDLMPGDVLVLVSDISRYAPHIRAVFTAGYGGKNLPVALADRTLGDEHVMFRAFLDLIDTATGRLERPDVRSLLEQDPVRLAFALTHEELDVLSYWLDELQVRWGFDGARRARHLGGDQPAEPTDAHSWQRGLDRLLLGLCTGPTDAALNGYRPFGEATAARAELVGRLATFLERLRDLGDSLQGPRSLADWSRVLQQAADDFLRPVATGDEDALRRLREILAAIASTADAAGHELDVDLATVVEHLRDRFAAEGRGDGFLTGAITFCTLRPMRSIPFRVVCVAGLEDGSFPRQEGRLPFDLISAGKRRRGDRSLRDEDRQLFLETMLAARERLVMTYTGRSQRDDSRRPPSVCIAELLELVDRTFNTGSTRPARDLVCVAHPLQPTSARYQGKHHLVTYTPLPERSDRVETRLVTAELGEACEARDEEEIALVDLLAFWDHPQKYFCRRVLGIFLDRELEPEDIAEPFLPNNLEQWQLRSELLERLAGQPDSTPEELEQWLRSADLLPHGKIGTLVVRRALTEIQPIRDHLARYELADVDLDIAGPGFRIRGTLEGVHAEGRVQTRPARVKARDQLRAWIQQLLLQEHVAKNPDGVLPVTEILGIGDHQRLQCAATPLARVEDLVAGFRAGHDRPLPFFRELSNKLVGHERYYERQGDQALTADLVRMRADWRRNSTYDLPKDGDDTWVRFAFRGLDPIDTDYASWARRILNPLHDALVDENRRPRKRRRS